MGVNTEFSGTQPVKGAAEKSTTASGITTLVNTLFEQPSEVVTVSRTGKVPEALKLCEGFAVTSSVVPLLSKSHAYPVIVVHEEAVAVETNPIM